MLSPLKSVFAMALLLASQECTRNNLLSPLNSHTPVAGPPSMALAVYEPWFGHPQHISVGYSSQDPIQIRKQIDAAKSRGISGFVVDWYGDREPFLDHAYALMQEAAAEKKFKVAMMYDESNGDVDQATDDALTAFDKFQETYLAQKAPGREAYLMYNNRPVIFIFPKGGHTDWARVRAEVDRWPAAPILINEDGTGANAKWMDGYYAWVNSGPKGWASDGSNWGGDYLEGFYQKMETKYPDKIAVGAAWARFDDSKASWGLNRHISARCGQTLTDTLNLAKQYDTAEHPLPFILIATWNDYEEGTAIERGIPTCKAGTQSGS